MAGKQMMAIVGAVFLLLLSIGQAGLLSAADAPPAINLPKPDMAGGEPLMSAMKNRRSDRNLGTGKISEQQLADLLWAAGGFNRPEENKLTVPVMKLEKDLLVHVILPDGAYRYDPANNRLVLLESGDHRALAAGPQAFAAKAPLNVVLSSGQKNETAAGIIVGHSSQNIYLYCASAGLNAVTRMTMDRKGMTELLRLPEDVRPLLVLTVGPRP